MISYDNLWNVMKEKGVSQYALIKKCNVSPAQITRLKRKSLSEMSIGEQKIYIFTDNYA